ncbi:glycosyltransferase family 2 protein [Iodobacter fluviatilis]|uniref:Chondroitin polymerase n=1 Tax=Iodobacter fluviatilis TaxID=537 RepID=A0A377SUB4_9NEIS|nr:glycosyltransferase family 2 protein [Iodobacter fluviatilis]TCU88121.1 glycosyltransferase involved in cell wall biosynthesis [Iodobacter fluviatilis]STR45621.1 Chondroitin polymerase [Iodobacter fluviatilis]
MNTAPIVSFVLPCYNSAAFLQATLDSISQQSFKQFECIAIDDGSSDATLALLQQHAQQDPRFIVISRANRGLISTLNEAIAVARGEWIARIDADDICHPQRIEKQLQRLQATGADVCGSWIRFFGDKTGEWMTPSSDGAIKAMLLFNSAFAHPSVIARAALLKANPYPPHAVHAEDYALWCTLAEVGATFTTVPEVLLDYRCHAGQITQSKKDELRATAQIIRSKYARFALPAAMQKRADRFVELAEPARQLSRAEFDWMCDFYLQLAEAWPASRSPLGEVWVDTLQRTSGVNLFLLGKVQALSQTLPPPASEISKLKRQKIRCLIGDKAWQLIKKLRLGI